MRKSILTAASISVLVFLAGCGGSTVPQFGVAEAKVIRQRTADFATTFNTKEVDKLVGFYASEIVFMPPNAPKCPRDFMRGCESGMLAAERKEIWERVSYPRFGRMA